MTAGFVRSARASDAAGLARVQVASWRATLAELVPGEVLAELTSDAALAGWTERWLEAIVNPPTSRHRVHVAVPAPGSAEVAGFAAAGPATDEDLWPGTDAELYELHVRPEHASADGGDAGAAAERGRGHVRRGRVLDRVRVGAGGRRGADRVPLGRGLGAGRCPVQPGHGREGAGGAAAYAAVAFFFSPA